MRSQLRCALGMFLTVALQTAFAAPLLPLKSTTTLSIGGRANIGQYPLSYSGSLNSTNWVKTSLQIVDGGTVGGIPESPGFGQAESLTGLKVERMADNEFLITLSSRASTALSRPTLNYGGDSDARSSLLANLQLLIGSDDRHPQGSTTAVIIELQEKGKMGFQKAGKASSILNLDVTVPGQTFHYNDTLYAPTLSLDPFDGITWEGTRNRSISSRLTATVGQTLVINTNWVTDAYTALDSMPALDRAAYVDFTDGVILHLTVLPEPATAMLLAIGAVLLTRRRTAPAVA